MFAMSSINSLKSHDKSTQTEPLVVGHSWLAEPSEDSLPQLPNHEISQIIADAIDNLPPGSLLPIEESVFARGSKRNIIYQAELRAKMALSINGKANVSASHHSQQSSEVSKSDQRGLAFSNHFSSLAHHHKKPEKDSQMTSKPLFGPGLYARSGRPAVAKHVDSEDANGRSLSYSPAPGVFVKFESVDKPLLSRTSSKGEEEPRTSSSNPPSTLNDSAETTTTSSQEPQLPPHLRVAQSSDPDKSETSSISESTQVGSPQASHPIDSAVREVTLHSTPVIKSVNVEHLEPSSPFGSSIAPAVDSVALEGKGPSPAHLIKENQSYESSAATKKLPPHLRNAVPRAPEKLIAKSQESTPSAFSSPDKLTPHEKGKGPVTQQAVSVIATGAKSNGSTTSAFSTADKFTTHENGKTSVTQQVLIVSDTETKSNVPTIPKFSSPSTLIPYEKSKGPAPQQILPATVPAPGASLSEEVGLNVDDALYFKAWPKSDLRDSPPVEIRTAIIENLPSNSTPSLVTSIVSGGALERIDVKGSTACVLFLHAKDCQKFYDATANDLDYSFEDRKGVAKVSKATDVNVVSGQVRTWIQAGFTRCVRVKDIRSDLNDEELKEKLREKAAYKNRIVEDVVIGITETNKELRFAIVRFCDIHHAIQFKNALTREEEWEECNIHFSPDPCAR